MLRKKVWAADLLAKPKPGKQKIMVKQESILDRCFVALYKKKGSGRLVQAYLAATNLDDAVREAPLEKMFGSGRSTKVYYLYGVS